MTSGRSALRRTAELRPEQGNRQDAKNAKVAKSGSIRKRWRLGQTVSGCRRNAGFAAGGAGLPTGAGGPGWARLARTSGLVHDVCGSEETNVQRETIPLTELQLPAFGAWEPGWFLLTAGENRPGGYNSMTVSWGALGVIWHRPLAVVVVRPQRYTRQFIEQYDTFSLSAFDESYRETLNTLGTLSGRDSQKMRDCGLTPIALSTIACPGFAEAKLILECRKMYYDDLEPGHFLADFIAPNYQGDYHRMYFGEVLAANGTIEFRRRDH
jgi:flavin reductase (DIM6/NTAB) family NADH-FMN oxidoreductase RutF